MPLFDRSLLWMGLKSRWFFFTDYCRTVWRYYRKPSFAKVDLALLTSYLFRNPYRISRRFLQEKGESDVYAYGETPLTTMEKIGFECGITEKDRVYELGSGRGRTCFWLNQWLGCSVVGVEYIPDFVLRARSIAETCQCRNIEFQLEDFTETALEDASVIYLFGTCLDKPSIKKIINNLSKAPSGTKVISVSYPLTDYDSDQILTLQKQFSGIFPWGKALIYLHKIS